MKSAESSLRGQSLHPHHSGRTVRFLLHEQCRVTVCAQCYGNHQRHPHLDYPSLSSMPFLPELQPLCPLLTKVFAYSKQLRNSSRIQISVKNGKAVTERKGFTVPHIYWLFLLSGTRHVALSINSKGTLQAANRNTPVIFLI